jgi:transposase-like protein
MSIEFPITDLLDEQASTQWVMEHFHVQGLHCPNQQCKAGVQDARVFRRTRRSEVTVYRCRLCQRIYTIYTGTVFEHKHLTPAQVVMLLRGVLKGESSVGLAKELGLARSTVHLIRRELQANAESLLPNTTLQDAQTETDEMFVNAGEKRGASPQLVGPTQTPS